MDIKVYILDKRVKGQYIKPIEYQFHGNYGLELMFFRISEIYYGKQVSLQIESVIKSKLE
jgi:hypothetical protein